MGQRGPNREPLEVLQARGASRAARRAREQVTPVDGEVRMPTGMCARAKAIWKELLPQLQQMRVIAPTDRYALRQLCETIAKHESVCAELLTTGEVVESPHNGMLQKHPLVTIRTQCEAVMYRLMREFGLTPASRSNATTIKSPEKAADPKLAYFRKAN